MITNTTELNLNEMETVNGAGVAEFFKELYTRYKKLSEEINK